MVLGNYQASSPPPPPVPQLLEIARPCAIIGNSWRTLAKVRPCAIIVQLLCNCAIIVQRSDLVQLLCNYAIAIVQLLCRGQTLCNYWEFLVHTCKSVSFVCILKLLKHIWF